MYWTNTIIGNVSVLGKKGNEKPLFKLYAFTQSIQIFANHVNGKKMPSNIGDATFWSENLYSSEA